MVESNLVTLLMDHHGPSTLLSMDSSASSHDELDLEMNAQILISRPPDINLPPSADRSPPPPESWNSEPCDVLDVTLGSHVFEAENFITVSKVGRKCAKRVDSIWGAWVFFSFYFKPALNDKSNAKIIRDSNGVSGYDKSDLKLDIFMVQHDMENMYMWVFKDRPDHALGKMQLRSFMNGHSRQGECLFPYSVDKGFARSHRMQRKHYRGLSNPQCVHGIEVVPHPNLKGLDEEERKRWVELTGRDINFSIPPEASDFGSWRNLPNTDFELDRHPPSLKCNSNSHSKKLLKGSGLNLATTQSSNQLNSHGDAMDNSPPRRKRKDFFQHESEDDCQLVENPPSDRIRELFIYANEPQWPNEFTGVMRNVYGPVTAAKTIYEDETGYLIIISLPFVDLQRVKVSWRNTPMQGILKVCCVSTSRTPSIKRDNRTFKLSESSAEHCPPGEFIREIPLATRIPEDANIEAYCDGPGSVLEIMVPKLSVEPEEHEVRVCFRPHLGGNDLMLT